jgi:hypothetical protein
MDPIYFPIHQTSLKICSVWIAQKLSILLAPITLPWTEYYLHALNDIPDKCHQYHKTYILETPYYMIYVVTTHGYYTHFLELFFYIRIVV